MATSCSVERTPNAPRDGETPLELGRLLVYVMAAASLSAGVLHCSAAADHAAEHLPVHAVLFAITGIGQAVWAAYVLRARLPRWLVTTAVVGNLGLVGVWGLSRTTGVPFIPGAADVEPIGFKDTAVVLMQLALVAAIALWAALPNSGRRLALPAGRTSVRGLTAAVAALSLFGLVAPAGHHHDDGHVNHPAGDPRLASTHGLSDHAAMSPAEASVTAAEGRREMPGHDHPCVDGAPIGDVAVLDNTSLVNGLSEHPHATTGHRAATAATFDHRERVKAHHPDAELAGDTDRGNADDEHQYHAPSGAEGRPSESHRESGHDGRRDDSESILDRVLSLIDKQR